MRAIRVIRAAGSAVLFAGFGIGALGLGIAVFPVLALFLRGRRAKSVMRALVRASYRLFVFAAWAMGVFRVDRSRAGALAATRGKVIAANHITLIDIVILIAALPETTCVVKSSAGRNFFMRGVVRRLFIVNDGEPGAVLAAAREELAAGVNVVVFPEGTRVPAAAARHHLRRGAAWLAIDSGVPVLPVRIGCDPPVLAKGQPWWDVADRTIRYTLETCDQIVPGPQTGRLAAMALSAKIGEALFVAKRTGRL